jgi:hypothetical protein
MPIRDLVEELLRQPEPIWQLRGMARGLIWHGYGREALFGELDRVRDELMDAGQEEDADQLTEALTFFIGWCAPGLEL